MQALIEFSNNLNPVLVILVFTSFHDFQYDVTAFLAQDELLQWFKTPEKLQ